ncbi:FAD/NAD(P)-binding domain-containing protein [Dothidotthia symphoricarpi CBS 119687]|uniref:FAD/NAD(P)-binding domain-containing protein n=1 Tax=Dothidotthia symphoricarpi CBS 119687 TaxID=1392245 RepID=A0A6A6AHQ7_9PLEO|nr:FAD/NAD(P)-binding domain-containing protein [Dothidotthia symphoricarpi CBS 119687]KAF2130404.1 FAD/NAD(P)-binding domain-containing protein [Dothidotthia symphoricarpi CBS 119687]
MESQQCIRVAIVGSGMAGLVTANLLLRDDRKRYAVKVFESGNSLSLDSASVSIPNAARTSSDRVDLPMRAFAGGFYSNLKALYDYLGVQYHSQPFLFEFARSTNAPSQQGAQRDATYFAHASNLHQLAPRPSTIGIIPYLMEFAYMAACYVWFSLCCFLVATHPGETLQQYLERTWTPERFVTYYLVPLISGVTTCPHKTLLAFPASDVIEYKRRTHKAPHYTVSEGVQAAQDRLVRGVDYELGAAITAVEPQEKGVKVSWKKSDGSDDSVQSEYFDRVVLAVAPDVVGRVFEPLRHHMTRIPTAVVESVVHTDSSVLAQEPQMQNAADAHGAQLIHLNTSTTDTHTTESHHVQPCGAIVTTCPFSPIEPSLTIHSAKFTRVLRSPESQRIVNAMFRETEETFSDEKSVPLWKNGDDNVWLVGGWCWDGMVLLEGCVISAMRVAHAFGVQIPWQSERA